MALHPEYIKKPEKIIQELRIDISSYFRLYLYQLIQDKDKAVPFKPHLGSQSSDEDILVPAEKKLSVLDHIDEE